jgi:hypothetical protein
MNSVCNVVVQDNQRFYIVVVQALDLAETGRQHFVILRIFVLVTMGTTRLTFVNSAFCPHSVFMCFVWISEQTATIFLYTINWLGFVTLTECLLRGMGGVFK